MAYSTPAVSYEKNERELWSGTPRQGMLFRPADAFMIPFSVLWAGFAIFWESSAFADGAPLFFLLWGIPFVLAGLYITIGRFFVDARRRRNTTYALTNEHVVIRSGLFNPVVKSLTLRTLSDITLSERSNGSGTITFGPANPLLAMYAGMQWPGMEHAPSFEEIPNARRVYDLIRDAQRTATSS